jgi:glucose/arabinose dehydrogenase
MHVAASLQRYIASSASWTVVILVSFCTVACDKKSDAPDTPGVTLGQPEIVTGSERIGWTQTASDRAELDTFRYAIYLNDVRSELAGASCQPPAGRASSDFVCSAPLPALASGTNKIELAAFIIGAQILESAKSTPLFVSKAVMASKMPATPRETSSTPWSNGLTLTTLDGIRLRVDRRAAGLVRPVDIAFVPDGRLLIAEESGRVLVLTADGRLLAEPALTLTRGRGGDTRLLSLAVDPAFDRTHLVYAVYTTAAADGSRAFTLSRFTEASNAIFGEIVLLDRVPAAASSSASVRVGADGKLFVAFDDGGDPRRAGDLASPSGKVLRLNPDGTTPDDQAGLTPTYATDLRSPRGFDWQPGSRVLWITDRRSDDTATLTAVASSAPTQHRGVRLAAYSLPRDTRPSSATFLRGTALPGLQNDLLIASAEGRHLLRVRFDRSSSTRVASTERLLQDVVGSVRVVAVAPDAGLYIATDDAVAQISMAE